jgi:hypothetical protein
MLMMVSGGWPTQHHRYMYRERKLDNTTIFRTIIFSFIMETFDY